MSNIYTCPTYRHVQHIYKKHSLLQKLDLNMASWYIYRLKIDWFSKWFTILTIMKSRNIVFDWFLVILIFRFFFKNHFWCHIWNFHRDIFVHFQLLFWHLHGWITHHFFEKLPKIIKGPPKRTLRSPERSDSLPFDACLIFDVSMAVTSGFLGAPRKAWAMGQTLSLNDWSISRRLKHVSMVEACLKGRSMSQRAKHVSTGETLT